MSIARNTVYNIAGAIFPVAVSILTIPIYIREIGLERYGILALCWLMMGYVGFLNLGLGPALAQKLASGQDSDAGHNETFWSALWLNLAMGLIAASLLYIFAGSYFVHLAGISDSLLNEARTSIPVIAAIAPVVMLNGVMVAALHGRERFAASNAIGALSTTLMALLPLLVALLLGPRLAWLVLAALIARLLPIFVMFRWCWIYVPLHGPALPSIRLLKGLLSFGGWVSITSVVGPFLTMIDRFAIGARLGAAAVSHYTIPYALVARTVVVPQSLATALFPRFAYVGGKEARQLEAQAITVLSCVMTPIILVLITIIRPFLELWVGVDVAQHSAPIAYVLLVGFWINGFARIPFARLQGTGHPEAVAKLHLAELIPYLVLLWLGLTYFGLIGAAFAWTIRTTADAIALFVVAKITARSLKPLIPSAAAVLLACGVAWHLSYRSTEYWIATGLIFTAIVVWLVANLPPMLRKYLDAARGWTRTKSQ